VKPIRLLPTLAAAALAASAAIAQAAPPADDPFPCPASLKEGVEFWKKVWGTWTLGQVALHDMEHPSIVYEVFDLPGEVTDLYTDAQRDYVKSRREAVAQRLSAIEKKVDEGAPLDDDEKALTLKITEAAGGDGVKGASLRVRSQRGLRERFRRGLEISGRYGVEFEKIFRDAGLPEDLAYLPHVESSFQAAARSSAGAVGVWQFTRGAARKFMLVTAGLDERLDPVAAARGAARYLKSAYDDLGTWPLAITSYNHGVEGMCAAKERFGTDFERILAEYDGRTFGFASKNFYKEFLAAREIARNPEIYFPEGITPAAPLADDRVVLDAPTTAATLSARYGISVAGLSTLNPAWSSKAIDGRAPLPEGTHVWLPEGTLATLASAGTPRRKLAREPKPLYAAGAPTSSPTALLAVHVVKKGETLFRIATSYGVSLARLMDANGLPHGATIHPGQQIRIPTVR
jgi:membrane-bound lytic murein transglycosylase D